MPEIRFDPLGRRHVILAPDRARRGAPRFEPERPDPEPCDFCRGREDRTPPETYAIREEGTEPDAPGWRVRVVPNLYPATAYHEVIVHAPGHYLRFEELDAGHRADVVRAYRDRVRARGANAGVAVYNRGRAAGASRTHDHGQVFGLDLVPPTLEREAQTFAEAPCTLCSLAGDGEIAVTESGGWRLLAHPVPVVANELLVVPRCTPRFDELPEEELGRGGDLIAEAIRRTERALGAGVPFNFVIHTAPAGTEVFHWHAHLMPRTATWAGLELGADLPIVAADPYETAAKLRAS